MAKSKEELRARAVEIMDKITTDWENREGTEREYEDTLAWLMEKLK